MNCNIVDTTKGNEKIRSVRFEEIEQIVEDIFNETLEMEDQEPTTEDDIYNCNYNYDLPLDENDILCLKIDYEANYLKKELIHIMKYYGLSTRKKNKNDCIDDIVEFETQPENIYIVEHRKTLWMNLNSLKEDEYLSQFIRMD